MARQSKAAELRRAVSLYRDFHGEHPRFVDEYFVRVPLVAMQIGLCTGVAYKTKIDGQTHEYMHEFTGRSRPILAASADGRQMVFLGGQYKMTERGIVDDVVVVERKR